MSEKSGGSAKCFEISVGRDAKSELELSWTESSGGTRQGSVEGHVGLNLIEAEISFFLKQQRIQLKKGR